MQTVGIVALIVVALFVAMALFFAVLAVPDVRRYMRIRRM